MPSPIPQIYNTQAPAKEKNPCGKAHPVFKNKTCTLPKGHKPVNTHCQEKWTGTQVVKLWW